MLKVMCVSRFVVSKGGRLFAANVCKAETTLKTRECSYQDAASCFCRASNKMSGLQPQEVGSSNVKTDHDWSLHIVQHGSVLTH